MTRYADTIGPKPQRDSIRGADAFLSKFNDDEARADNGQWTVGAAGSTAAHAGGFGRVSRMEHDHAILSAKGSRTIGTLTHQHEHTSVHVHAVDSPRVVRSRVVWAKR